MRVKKFKQILNTSIDFFSILWIFCAKNVCKLFLQQTKSWKILLSQKLLGVLMLLGKTYINFANLFGFMHKRFISALSGWKMHFLSQFCFFAVYQKCICPKKCAKSAFRIQMQKTQKFQPVKL